MHLLCFSILSPLFTIREQRVVIWAVMTYCIGISEPEKRFSWKWIQWKFILGCTNCQLCGWLNHLSLRLIWWLEKLLWGNKDDCEDWLHYYPDYKRYKLSPVLAALYSHCNMATRRMGPRWCQHFRSAKSLPDFLGPAMRCSRHAVRWRLAWGRCGWRKNWVL